MYIIMILKSLKKIKKISNVNIVKGETIENHLRL